MTVVNCQLDRNNYPAAIYEKHALKIKKIATKNYVDGEEKEIGRIKFVDKMRRI